MKRNFEGVTILKRGHGGPSSVLGLFGVISSARTHWSVNQEKGVYSKMGLEL
jgi:hypothetical protein